MVSAKSVDVHESSLLMIAALILAAGNGSRFGSTGLPKQFSEIAGKPLFIHSVLTYVGIAEIDRVIVVANPKLTEQTRDVLQQYNLLARVELATGGATRQESVQNAAALVAEDGLSDQDIVILHNSVSPNTSSDFIRTCLSAMSDSEVVQACVADTRTVFETDGKFVKCVLPRSSLVYNCDPMVYRGDVFRHVLEVQKNRGMLGNTTSETARELGYKIRLAYSGYDNIKVTNRWDLEAVRAAMEHGVE